METKALEQKIAALISIVNEARSISHAMRIAAENVTSHHSISANVIPFNNHQ